MIVVNECRFVHLEDLFGIDPPELTTTCIFTKTDMLQCSEEQLFVLMDDLDLGIVGYSACYAKPQGIIPEIRQPSAFSIITINQGMLPFVFALLKVQESGRLLQKGASVQAALFQKTRHQYSRISSPTNLADQA